MYLINNINDDKIRENLKKNLKFDALMFVAFLVAFLLFLVLKSGYGVNQNGVVEMVRFKYGLNYLEMPIILIMLLIGLILALFGLYKAIFTTSIKGIFPIRSWCCFSCNECIFGSWTKLHSLLSITL